MAKNEPKPAPAKPPKGEIAVEVERLCQDADKLRCTVDAAEYKKHVVLGTEESKARDVLDRVCKNFLGNSFMPKA